MQGFVGFRWIRVSEDELAFLPLIFPDLLNSLKMVIGALWPMETKSGVFI